jgi:hypothetical protein
MTLPWIVKSKTQDKAAHYSLNHNGLCFLWAILAQVIHRFANPQAPNWLTPGPVASTIRPRLKRDY